jgi:Xaa-Pro aminopeptidase
MLSIKSELERDGIKRMGIEQNHVTYGSYLSTSQQLAPIELVPTEDLVEGLRMKKDEEELAIMQEAAELADRTFAHIQSIIKPGLRELDVALELEMYMRKNGATGPSFDTIVASGERSALPHGIASERIIQAGEFVKLDFGAYYKGYCSDITRTLVVGKPTDKHREIYDIVLEAQLHCLEHIRPGMTGKEADALTRDIITRYGYSDHFGHGTGHGLGLEIHESPRLSPTSDLVLEPGMTVTVEPGIYLPHFGGVRIEDDIVITKTGMKRLTSSSKDFLVIDI